MKKLAVLAMVLVVLVLTVSPVFADGPTYNNTYTGTVGRYLYDSGYGYMSAYHNAGVAGQYYLGQATNYVQTETSWGAPTSTYNWLASQW